MAMGMAGEATAQPQLALHGEPYFDGSMTLSLTAENEIGQPALVAFGLNPLTPPMMTGKGDWYIGNLSNVFSLGAIPTSGRIDFPFAMPPDTPIIQGIVIVMQGYVGGQLSNPTTLTMDQPYLVPATAVVLSPPAPTVGAIFGDTLAVGDLNNDGVTDLVVGAWNEDYAGINKSGRVYVFWGPDFASHMTLEPSSPTAFGYFGAGIAIADLDGDLIHDLVVAETPGSPPIPGKSGQLHIFLGGSTFAATPAASIPSLGTGTVYTLFGRILAIGDFNGDLQNDIAVGIHKATVSGFTNAGRIDVYWGPTFDTVLSIENPAPAASDAFGVFLAVADVSGDGIDDLIEGSGQDDINGEVNIGSVHVFTGPGLTLLKTIENPIPQGFNSRFGEEVHGQDLDGDGKAEIIAIDLKNRVYIFWSPTYDTFTDIRKPEALNTASINSVSFGYFVETADVNHDGFIDILISDIFEGETTCASAKEGTLFVALGPFYSTFLVLRNPMPACGDNFSWRITVADVDGDDVDDVLMSSITADDGGVSNSGRVFIFSDSPSAGP